MSAAVCRVTGAGGRSAQYLPSLGLCVRPIPAALDDNGPLAETDLWCTFRLIVSGWKEGHKADFLSPLNLTVYYLFKNI